MKRIEHIGENFPFNFVEYAPSNPNVKLPLIIQLHGAGERGDTPEELSKVDIHGFSKILNDKEIPCRFIMPQCPINSFWAARVESILKFINQLKEHFNVDENRIYLTGLSMGGFGTWFTAMASPDTFAAIAPVCGGGMAWNVGVLNMPIWTFHGVIDETVGVVNTDMMVDALKGQQKDVKYTRLEGVGHNAWDYTYDMKLIDWLLSKSK